MFRFLRKHRTVLMVTMLLVLVGLPFFGIGTNYLLSSSQDVVVKINGEKVTQQQFDRIYNQMVRQKKDILPQEKEKLHSQAFNELLRLTVFEQEARRYGIYVPDQELRMLLDSTKAFQKDGHFDPATYFQTIHQIFGTSPAEFEKMRKKDLAANKLNQLIGASVHVSDAELADVLPLKLAAEKDAKKKKEWAENPELLRQELQKEQTNWVFSDWLNQLNTSLNGKIEIVSDNFKKTLSNPGAS